MMKARDLPLHYNAVDILERNLEKRASKPALLSVEREATFGEISEEVNRVGNALREMGVNFGDCVAILALDSVKPEAFPDDKLTMLRVATHQVSTILNQIRELEQVRRASHARIWREVKPRGLSRSR